MGCNKANLPIRVWINGAEQVSLYDGHSYNCDCPVCEGMRADLQMRELKDSESAKIESKLRTLAQAVLREHGRSCYFCPLESSDCIHITTKYCCQCEACTIAREVLK